MSGAASCRCLSVQAPFQKGPKSLSARPMRGPEPSMTRRFRCLWLARKVWACFLTSWLAGLPPRCRVTSTVEQERLRSIGAEEPGRFHLPHPVSFYPFDHQARRVSLPATSIAQAQRWYRAGRRGQVCPRSGWACSTASAATAGNRGRSGPEVGSGPLSHWVLSHRSASPLISSTVSPRRLDCTDQIGNRLDNVARAVGKFCDLSAPGRSGKHKMCGQARLHARHDVRVHAVPNHCRGR